MLNPSCIARVKGTLAIISLGLALDLGVHRAAEAAVVQGYLVPEYAHRVLPLLNLDASISAQEDTVRRVPDSSLGRVALGGLYLQKSQRNGELRLVDQAEEQAKKALEILPVPNPGAKLILSRVAEERHRFGESIRIAQETLTEVPGHEGALTALVTSHLGYGNLKEAEKFAERTVESYPYLDAYLLRGLVKEARGKEDEAISDYVQGLQTEDLGSMESSAYGRALLARLHLSRGRHEVADALLRQALVIVPGYHLALGLQATLEERRGNVARADQLYQEAYAALNEPPYLMDHANLKESRGDADGALKLRKQAEEAIRREAVSGPYGHHNELSRVILELKDPAQLPEALSETEIEVGLRPTAESFYLRAWALSEAKRWDEARAAVAKALETGIQDAQYTHRAGLIEEGLGNRELALERYEEALQIDPSFKNARASMNALIIDP